MVQGTSSSVGKSVLVAGLCRLFFQEGVRVAPFKSQNMALNSFATPDGLEIGRAQAVQAEAAGLPPSADMNPILLKPEGDARSQVVVSGRVWGTLSAAEYQARKEEFWPVAEASLRRLMATFDLVLIEGAGSPVEMNLKAHDIVNMRVARAAPAPVLLVADIDRGGVFASLVGTLELLEPEERALVAGIIVNKFRGDLALFRSGLEFLERRTRKKTLGVIPWIEDLGIAEEDSQNLAAAPARPGGDLLSVVVVKLPHIANFDDFDPLARRPGVALRYVDRPDALGTPDLLILPGTKTTRADLAFVRARGLDRAIQSYAGRGGAVLGICGGYQMLCQRLDDPEGAEGDPGSVSVLGLLPGVTRYAPEKATVQVEGRVQASRGLFADAHGLPVSAYEIHVGRTDPSASPAFCIRDQSGPHVDGQVSEDGWIAGTYFHGLFANVDFTEAMLSALARRRGLALAANGARVDPYDRLAGILREHLDVDLLRQIAGV